MKTLGLFSISLLLAGGGAAYVFRDHLLPEPELYTACEAELSTRLTTAQTYQRVSMDVRAERVAPEDAMDPIPDWAKDDAEYTATWQRQLEIYRASDPHRFTVLISYDTSNRYGVPIRSRTICEYIALYPADLDQLQVQAWQVKIDGLTGMDLAHQRITELNAMIPRQ